MEQLETMEEEAETEEEKIPPRKKGMARFLEILGRDYMNLMSAGALALVSLLPFGFGVSIAIISKSVAILLIGGILGGMIAAPQVTGLYDTVLRSLRDEPFLWWMTYKESWKANFGCSLIPGALVGLVSALQLFAFYVLPFHSLPLWNIVVYVVSILLSISLSLMMFVQLPLMELGLGALLRNAVMMTLRFLPKMCLISLLGVGYLLLALWCMPAGILLFLILNTWFPVMIATMMIYRNINEVFQIEQRLTGKDQEE